jgi:hypothetical protein
MLLIDVPGGEVNVKLECVKPGTVTPMMRFVIPRPMSRPPGHATHALPTIDADGSHASVLY